jgi:hypothetical protein
VSLLQILERAEKARVLTELKAELASVLGKPGNVPIPRGWAAAEARLFEALPAAVQEIIHRRRDLDVRELRRLQTTVAKMRHSLTEPLAQTEKEISQHG